ncbi:hypothetical protein SDC9_75524 [bioreactor metagenome]|uniref:Uncharacterized protein n=1 Tax=bioreactor metagenome TaxID=1076179 RepID=A0A644YKG0_9ZZZZ
MIGRRRSTPGRSRCARGAARSDRAGVHHRGAAAGRATTGGAAGRRVLADAPEAGHLGEGFQPDALEDGAHRDAVRGLSGHRGPDPGALPTELFAGRLGEVGAEAAAGVVGVHRHRVEQADPPGMEHIGQATAQHPGHRAGLHRGAQADPDDRTVRFRDEGESVRVVAEGVRSTEQRLVSHLTANDRLHGGEVHRGGEADAEN